MLTTFLFLSMNSFLAQRNERRKSLRTFTEAQILDIAAAQPCPSSLDNQSKQKLATHQGSFAEQFAAAHEVSDRHVEVRVAAAPVGDLGERMCCQDILSETFKIQLHFFLS